MLGLAHRERRGRLVEQQDVALEVDGAGDGDGLLLAAGEEADLFARIVDAGDLDRAAEDVDGDILHLLMVHEPERFEQISRPMKMLRVIDIESTSAMSW